MRLKRKLGLLKLLVLAACAILSPERGWSLERIRIGLSVKSVVFLPFYYAKDKKIFKKHGLDVEIIQIRSDLQMVGLVSGEIDFTPALGPAILAIQNGMPIKAVAVFYRAPLLSLVAHRQLTHPRGLEGGKVGVSRLGSESHRYGVLMLERSGVDPKKVTFIQTGSTTVSLAALEQGSVQAAVLSPPFTGAMAQKGFKILMKSRELVEAPWLGLVTSRDKIQKRPEQVRTMLVAMREVLRVIRQDRPAVVAYIRENFKVSQGVDEEAYEDINGVLIEGMRMEENQIRNYLEGAYKRGELNKPLTVSEVIDYSLLR